MERKLNKKINAFKNSKIIFNAVNSNGEFVTLNQFKLFDNSSINLFFNVICDEEFLKYVHGVRFFIDSKTKTADNMGIKNIYIQLKRNSLGTKFVEYQLDCIRASSYQDYPNGVPDKIYQLIKPSDKLLLDEINYRLINNIPVNQ